MTYTYLNLAFIAFALVAVFALTRKTKLPLKVLGLATVCLLLLTAISDNFIVASGIVAYTESNILGLRIGVAPIEDFAYALVAALALPALWNHLGRRKK